MDALCAQGWCSYCSTPAPPWTLLTQDRYAGEQAHASCFVYPGAEDATHWSIYNLC